MSETEWMPGDWGAVKTGDTVRLEKGIGALEGVVEFVCPPPWEKRIVIADAIFEASGGWNLFVPAPPKPELPTQRGLYVTSGGGPLEDKTVLSLSSLGWQFTNGTPALETATQWHRVAPLVSLAPVAETLETFIAALAEKCPKEGNTYRVHSADLVEAAASMGVSL